MKRDGWTKVDPGRHGGCGARWERPSGWAVQHCGHPTAHFSWYIESPAGDFDGRTFRYLRDAMFEAETLELRAKVAGIGVVVVGRSGVTP